MMRLAIVATPATLPDLRPAPGSLDGDVLRSRLVLPDAGFHVINVDPTVDLAEQAWLLFEQNAWPAGTPVFFYASTAVALSVEGELYLCLDPANPDTGDSVRDVAGVFADRAPGPVTFVLECRHAPAPEDPFRSASVVSAAKEAVRAAGERKAIELLVTARPATGEADEGASALTRALVEAIDAAGPGEVVTIEGLYGRLRDSDALVGVVPGFSHVRAPRSLTLAIGAEAPAAEAPAVEEEAAAPAEEAGEDEDLPLDEADLEEEHEEEIAVDVESPIAAIAAAPVAEQAPASGASAQRASVSFVIAEARSPARVEPELPSIIVGGPRSSAPSEAPARVTPPTSAPPVEIRPAQASAPEVAPPTSAPPARAPSSPQPTHLDHVAAGDAMMLANDIEGALASYRRALGMLGNAASVERADIYVRIGRAKRQQEKRREAIANMEKALQIVPLHREALEALVELNLAEGDLRAVQSAEERLLATVTDPEARFAKLLEHGARWDARDPARARAIYERALEMRPEHVGVLEKLRASYEAAGATEKVLAIRRKLAALADAPRSKAEQLFALGNTCLELRREDEALELFDAALEADPTMLEPLTVIARFYADRQEWSELERAYRRMIERAPRIPSRDVRREVTWELHRRLALLFRDHLEDAAAALASFEDALMQKPADLSTRLVCAELARSLGEHERAMKHLQVAAVIEPGRVETLHELFEMFQRLRRPDQAFSVAQVTMLLRKADARERIVFEEHKPEGVPKFARGLRPESWDLLRPGDRDRNVEAILAAITDAAVGVRLAQLATEGRLPALDPAARQDPQKTTVSIVRSFAWASHFLGVQPPAIYLHDDPNVGLVAVIAEEPTALAGGRVLRGRSLAELAFLVGRHFGYHVGGHRLLLYYPSIEELSTCFIAAVKIAVPELPVPASARAAVIDLADRIDPLVRGPARAELMRAVGAFQAAGGRADLASWVGMVERCAARAGALLCGDLEVAVRILREDPLGVLGAEEKIADLITFTISDQHRALREELGVAIEP